MYRTSNSESNFDLEHNPLAFRIVLSENELGRKQAVHIAHCQLVCWQPKSYLWHNVNIITRISKCRHTMKHLVLTQGRMLNTDLDFLNLDCLVSKLLPTKGQTFPGTKNQILFLEYSHFCNLSNVKTFPQYHSGSSLLDISLLLDKNLPNHHNPKSRKTVT